MAFHMPTVLVVEDEPLIRMLLSEALEEAGYRVFEAGCVLEAVAALGFQKIDAVVTDIDMPGGLSGIDLAWLVDGAFKSTTIVVASGGQYPARDVLPHSAYFFPKPYRLDDIVGVLGEVGRLPGLETRGIAV